MLSSGKPAEPQSWNRYAYVLNNPLMFTDPTGLKWAYHVNGNTRTFQYYDGDTIPTGEGWEGEWSEYNSSYFVGSNELLWLDSGSNNYLRVDKERFSGDG